MKYFSVFDVPLESQMYIYKYITLLQYALIFINYTSVTEDLGRWFRWITDYFVLLFVEISDAQGFKSCAFVGELPLDTWSAPARRIGENSFLSFAREHRSNRKRIRINELTKMFVNRWKFVGTEICFAFDQRDNKTISTGESEFQMLSEKQCKIFERFWRYLRYR